MDPEKLKARIEELEKKASDLVEKLGKDGEEPEADLDVKAVAAELKGVQEEIAEIQKEKEAAEAAADLKAMRTQIQELTDVVAELAKPLRDYGFTPSGVPGRKAPGQLGLAGKAEDGSDIVYGPGGAAHSFYNDVMLARHGNRKAYDRLEKAKEAAAENYPFDAKAMQEAVDTQGGYLVVPEISNELIRLREQESVLRPLFSSQPIATDELRIAAVTNGLAVAWTAELTEKIINEFKFAEISAHVFTAAGLAVASNQLLADSRFSIDQLINQDMAKRFVSLEEQAFINGSGVGQPRGIRNTDGVEALPQKISGEATSTANIQNVLQRVSEAITQVYVTYFGPPDAILMHPRTWGAIVRAHEATSPSTYLIGAGRTAFGRRADEPQPGYTGKSVPRGELFGVPVYTTANVPTNLGNEANESCIIVGDFSTGLVLDRQGIVTDQSEHVFFTSNQTVFRSEERLGFTAARYPKAFKTVEGSALRGI